MAGNPAEWASVLGRGDMLVAIHRGGEGDVVVTDWELSDVTLVTGMNDAGIDRVLTG